MARFYKTSGQQQTDYTENLNIPLMQQALMTNDQYITQNLQQDQQLGELGTKFNRLSPDDEAANAIALQYQQRAADIAKAIQNDPANWKNKTKQIQQLSTDLKNDYAGGAISKYQANHQAYKDWNDQLNAQVDLYNKNGGIKSGHPIGIDPATASLMRTNALKNWSGTNYDPATGHYNALSIDAPVANMDIPKIMEEGLDKIKTDKSFNYHESVDGTKWYRNQLTQKDEILTPQVVQKIAFENLSGHPEIPAYLKSRIGLGLINGSVDNPFVKYQPTEADNNAIKDIEGQIAAEKNPQKKALMESQLAGLKNKMANITTLDPNNYFSPILDKLGEKYGFKDTYTKQAIVNNQEGATRFTTAHNDANQAANRAQKADEFGKNLAEKQYEFDHNQQLQRDLASAKLTGKNTTTKKVNGQNVVIPTKENMLLDSDGLNPYAFTGQDGIKDASTIVTRADALKTQESELLKHIATLPNNSAEKNVAMLSLQNVRDNLANVRDLYAKTDESAKKLALSNGDITPAYLSKYEKYIGLNNPEEAIKQEVLKRYGIKSFTDIFPDTKKESNPGKYPNDIQYTPDPRNGYLVKQQFNKELEAFKKAKNTISNYKNQYIQNLNANTKKESKLVQTNNNQDTEILNTISEAPSRFRLLDPKTGQEGGEDGTATFEGDKAGIIKYLQNNNKKLSDIVTIQGVTKPISYNTGSNQDATTGALVKVQFKSDAPKGVAGKTFMMTLPPVLQASLSKSLSASKDANIANFGNQLADSRKYDFVNSLDRTDQISHDLTDKGIDAIPAGQKTIEGANGQTYTIRSIPKRIGGRIVYQAQLLKDGKFVNFNRINTDGTSSEVFDSNLDIYNHIQPIIDAKK